MSDKYNVESAETLANSAQALPIAKATPIYEQLLQLFPTAAKFWKQYVEAHMAVNNDDATKQIFSRCLLNCLQVPLWRCYIRFFRKVNDKKGTEGQEETIKAFEFMLNYIAHMASNQMSATTRAGATNDALYKELWHACAGPLVTLPREGERVYYFPQGHMEQLEASMNQGLEQQMPSFNLPSKILCKVVNIHLRAEPEKDEVYAQITLLPESDEIHRELTDLCSASVNNESFTQAAIRRNLHPHLMHSSGLLQGQISEHVKAIMNQKKTTLYHSQGLKLLSFGRNGILFNAPAPSPKFSDSSACELGARSFVIMIALLIWRVVLL